jgi:UDP:flavonoid glycosyltransferase YjiC (YdhE family)
MVISTANQISLGAASLADPSHPLRILFIGEGVSLAHVGRPAVLAGWAHDAGHTIHFACGEVFDNVLRQENIERIPLRTIPPRTFYERLTAGQFFYTVDELTSYVRAEVDLIEDLQPDLVVGDFRLSLAVSTQICSVPMVSLANAYWSPASSCRFPPPNSGIFRVLPQRLSSSLFAGIRPIAFRMFGRSINELRRRFNLQILQDFREHYTAGEHCAYLDMPEMVPLTQLPENHFYLGPVYWESRANADFDLGNLGTRRPLVYVTLGSSGDDFCLPDVVQTVLASNCDIVLSGVSVKRFQELEREFPLSNRCLAAPILSPGEILRRSVATICHGGSGTIYQSLSAGVPVLAIPGNPDQALSSEAMAALGAGVCVPSRSVARCLPSLLNDVLNSACFSQCAKNTAQMLNRYETRLNWLKFLETASVKPGLRAPQQRRR